MNQFTVIEGQHNRRPDVVVFVNGLPLGLLELTGFFQAVRAVLAKGDGQGRNYDDDMDHAIRQIFSRAVASDEVVDIFAAAGLKKPDISILSDEFLAEVRDLPHKNLAVATLRKLLNNEIRIRSRKFLIQSRSFAEMLEASIRKYQNRAIEAAAVIEELIALARQIRQASQRGAALGLSDDEVAFYDALEVNDSAVKVLGDENLRFIARELLKTIRENVSIDWNPFAPSCASRSSASFADTAILPTNRRRPRRPFFSRRNCCARSGRRESSSRLGWASSTLSLIKSWSGR